MAGPKQEGGRRKPPALVTIRAAQPRDRRAVRRLCDRIWRDDYIPEVFDDWIRDREGRLWVAVDGGTVVGIAKLTVTPRGEAWLHGLRVDPDHRRRGIATALLEHRLQRAGRLAWYEASAIGAARPRSAGISELDAVWRLMRPRGPAARIELFRALRGEAKARRLSRAAAAAPSDLWRSATAAGYRRRWPDLTFVFEKRLGLRRDRGESRAPARVASIGPR